MQRRAAVPAPPGPAAPVAVRPTAVPAGVPLPGATRAAGSPSPYPAVPAHPAPVQRSSAAPGPLAALPTAHPRHDAGPVRRATNGLPLGGVADAFPAVQRATAAPAVTPTPLTGGPVVPPAPVRTAEAAPAADAVRLAPSPAAPPVALPVQRAPATPSVPSRLRKLVSPQRPAEPRATAVTVGRTGPGGGNGGRPPGPLRRAATDGGPPPSGARDPLGGPPGGTGGGAAFDARALSDGQVDELTHRLIGPLTRLLRTELRLDRERIGRLRDIRR